MRHFWKGGRIVIIAVMIAAGFLLLERRTDLVIYCAHDSIYADSIIRQFEQESGLQVAVRYDTEATKSLGLTELLIREAERPRCDVFWNNELLGTSDLKERGLLANYRGSGFRRIPDAFKDGGGAWVGFGARMRVYIVNTNLCAADLPQLEKRLAADDLSRIAMARPLYGTTLTHYAALWRQLGEEGLKAWHVSTRSRGMLELTGNSTVKNQVAGGGCDFGFTDSDDAFLALDAGAPVAMLPVYLPGGETIAIPNTVAMIGGCPHPETAQLFIDFLLSEKTELALANSASRQIPLGPVDEAKLSAEVRALVHPASLSTPLHELGAARTACISWLKQETM